mmetsp:Transcript_14673/g.35349  ORF Transcript_14673/g.35349 Transcript_14673/m.35349 type:complete len:236 (+) Transcript_14673:1185-1892(+)
MRIKIPLVLFRDCSNSSLISDKPPPLFSTASNGVVQQIPLNSVESLTTNLNLRLSPFLNLNSTPLQSLISNDKPSRKGVLRIPTNPPLFASVTVPVHIPVLPSKVEEEAPPMTTSSRGANPKKTWEEDEEVHSVSPWGQIIQHMLMKRHSYFLQIHTPNVMPYESSDRFYIQWAAWDAPGPTFRFILFFPASPKKGREGGVTNLELWVTNRKISHGFLSLLEDDALPSSVAASPA